MKEIAPIVLMALVALAGCASSDVKRTGDTLSPRPGDWPIEVYISTTAPVELIKAFPDAKIGPPPHTAIGLGTADAGMLVPWKRLQKMAEAQARSVGGDAILITDFVRDYLTTNPTFRFRILRWQP